MSGSKNDVIVGKNADFSQTNAPNPQTSESNGLFTNGDLWIGSTAVNAGGTHINVGNITSPLGTLTVGYSSPDITIDLAGGSTGIDSIAVDASTPPGTNPVLPTGAGQITMTGGQVANGVAGANVIRIQSLAANTVEVDIQRSETSAGSNSSVNGVAHFDVTDFSVDANGFVELATTGALKTLTGDTGTATPVANNIQIAGGPGVTTSASGAVVTINSVVFTDTTATTLAVDNGYNATAAGTYNMPATAAQGELIIVYCDTAGAVVLDCPALNFIRVGSVITSSGGTCTSTAQGDSLTLRYRLSSLTWEATSVVGIWVLA